MNDFLGIYADGNILLTFVRLIEVIIALDCFTLVAMVFGRAKNDL